MAKKRRSKKKWKKTSKKVPASHPVTEDKSISKPNEKVSPSPAKKVSRPSSPSLVVIPLWQRLLPLVLVLAALIVYFNSFNAAFILDDDGRIVRNIRIRSLGNMGKILSTERPLVELSLALNYAVGKLNPFGYHLFNLVFHMLAGLTLYGVIRRTLQLPRLNQKFGESAHWFALSITLLWIVHPLQTESVTYVIQRAEAMMGLFYLLTLYCFIRGSQAISAHRKYWYFGAVVSVGIGMGCKAIIITVPAVLILYDRIFLSTSVKETLQSRWLFYLFISMLFIISGSKAGIIQNTVKNSFKERPAGVTAQTLHGRAANPTEYYQTQPSVILNYFKLSFWPDDLCLDYKLSPLKDMRQIVLTSAVLLLLIAATGILLWQRPAMGFLAAFIFIVLAPTTYYWRLELAFEHRMYLSLAGLIAMVVFILHHALTTFRQKTALPRKTITVITTLLVLTASTALGARTVVRNRDYENRITMYRAVLRVQPENARAHYNLANPLSRLARDLRRQGKKEEADKLVSEAIVHYEEAIRLFPNYANARVNIALRYEDQKRMDEAFEMLHSAIKINPRHKQGLSNLGRLYYRQGNFLRRKGRKVEASQAYDNAVSYYNLALKERPRHITSIWGLGESLRYLKRFEEAEPYLRKYLKYKPKSARTMQSLGYVLIQLGQPVEAEKWIKKSLEIDPDSRWGKQLLREAKRRRT